jgi:hypothetical protein
MVNKKNSDKCRGRRNSVKTATPSWLSEADILHTARFYEIAVAMSEGKEKHEVDHIVPVNHPLVCGLHVPWNLQIITYAQNKAKGNSLQTDPLPDAITYDIVVENMSVRNKGLNAEVSGKRGRPPGSGKHQMAEAQQALLDQITKDAFNEEFKGQEAIGIYTMVLKHASELQLDLATIMKFAKELAPYQTARKASIEQKTESVSTYVVQYGFDTEVKQLENIVDIKPDEE